MKRVVTGPIIFALTVVLALAPPAAGQEQSRQTYTAKFTSSATGSSTGLRQSIQYRNPSDPEGKPYAVQQIIFALPKGSIVDTSVPPQCSANEAQFQASGTDACPAETRVGDGSLVADTGAEAGVFPRLIETGVTFFNNEEQLILFAESTNTPGPPIRIASRVQIRDKRELISTVPPLPGAPPPEPYLALKEVVNNLDELTVDGQPYITTPPSCPSGGKWTITATFTYRDGTVQSVDSKTPCTTSARDNTAPRIRLRGVPGRGCTAKDFRVRIHVTDRNSGLRRAHLSLDGRRLTATKANRFSRRIRAGDLRAGRHRLKVVAVDKAGNRSVKTKRFRSCVKKRTTPARGCGSRSLRPVFAAPPVRTSC